MKLFLLTMGMGAWFFTAWYECGY